METPEFRDQIDARAASGLRPEAWLCVGPGFSREEIKAELLSKSGTGIVGEAVTSIQEIALRLTGFRKDRVLQSLPRQEVLRMLLADTRISSRMQELKRLRRQGTFFRRLDSAIQAARLSFAHAEEAAVYGDKLESRFGPNPVRAEIEALSVAYETFLDARRILDPPLLIRRAIAVLEEGWPDSVPSPARVDFFTAQKPESLEAVFWEMLRRHVEVRFLGPLESPSPEPAAGKLQWERWHTADDAAEALAETFATVDDWSEDVVLIPESGSSRRSLNRALASLGVPQADPRDPTRIRWDETLKWAMLPLQLVARNFDRIEVLEYLRTHEMSEDFFRWSDEINARGIRMGLESYSGGILTPVHAKLSRLLSRVGGRKTCAELASAHLDILRERVRQHPEALWAIPFFEQVWKQFVEDGALVDARDRSAPPLYWVERLSARVAEAPAPVERAKPERGVAVYRLNQAPLKRARRVWVLAIPPDALAASVGDYWFSEREREVLAGEFAVRSAAQVRQERLACLRAWVEGAQSVVFLDALHEPDGRERESLRPLLLEVFGPSVPDEPAEKGAHDRWLPSFSPFRPAPPQEVRLPALPVVAGAKPEISATALDNYSCCPFLGLARSRWKLWDQQEPDTELAGNVRGTILHDAVRRLLESRGEEGTFTKSPSEALEEAWKAEPPRGLLRGRRVEKYVLNKLVQILEAFCEKEREYAARSGTKVVSMEDRKLRLEFDDFVVVGTPDRIDEHPAGLFIMDYKTSSVLPSGREMVELGYRLQLPFYALATKRETGKQAIGVQFIELSRKAGRGKGIFFAEFNGKEAGKLTATTKASHSLLDRVPDEVWSILEDRIVSHARASLSGIHDAAPKKRDECDSCMVQDVCGFRRLSNDASSEVSGE